MFPLSPQWVPNLFLNMFSIVPHFCPYALCSKCCPPFTCIAEPKGRNTNTSKGDDALGKEKNKEGHSET
jgi:hypothetical protein